MNVGFIILNYNDADRTKYLSEMILKYDSIFKVIVVDNCSTDKSFEKLKEISSEKLDVIISDKNGGYAYGNNYGLRYADNKYNLDLIFIANPDVEFDENFLEHILEQFNSSEYSMLSGIMTNANGQVTSPPAWKIPTFKEDLVDSFVLFEKIRQRKNKSLINYTNSIIDVDALSGSLFAIRASAFKDVEYFDEGTFLYCEETILARKLKQKGHKVGLLTGIKYFHLHASSTSKSLKTIEMRKTLFKSRYFYHVKYNEINFLQKCIFKTFMKLSLIEYGIYLVLKDFVFKIRYKSN